MTISFEATREELEIIGKIARRADAEVFGPNGIRQTITDTMMDISATHANGCQLKLAERRNGRCF